MNSAISQSPVTERIQRHDLYYIHGGDVIFRVENYLFRVHRYFFVRESPYFREKLPHPPPPGEFTKGSSDNNPFTLDDALSVDFARFLWVFYNPKYSLYNADVEEWTSILKLSHQWQFAEVKALALRELEQLEVGPIEKIITYHAYEIDRNLLIAAYTALTTRDEPITLEEGRKLGLETSLQLMHAREVARGSRTKGGRSMSPVNVTGSDLDALIKDLFQLQDAPGAADARVPTPETPSTPVDPNAPNGRSTPNGRATPTAANGATPKKDSFRATTGGSVMRTNGTANGHANGASVNGSANGAPNGAGRQGGNRR
ncbi:hypothetical protein BV25DRAFT_842370 [Artomyces pyxidatus]|uniref:Uncharacterized protein n=1 Tax=Artomyces pyxidatus TaxID=48021 RepID=A0ACB8TGR3_9AGAM|nr:hypothetical protein BV25DRAFT_842370 [Artomyces pyxidatus]